MKLKSPPFVPLHFFYFQLPKDARAAFWAVGLLLVVSVAGMVFTYHVPTQWTISTQTLLELDTEEAPVKTVEENYRSYSLYFPVYSAQESFTAGPLLPRPISVLPFGLLFMLGWAVWLTAASAMRSRWAYAPMFLFALFIFFARPGFALTGTTELIARGIDLLIAAVFLGLAFLFQINRLRWNFATRLATFGGLILLLFGLIFATDGWLAVHRMTADLVPLGLFVFTLSVFFLGKELPALWVALTNNRPARNQRLAFGWIVAGFALLLLTFLLLANAWMRWDLLPRGLDVPRPVHLLAIALLAVVFTSQNHYHFVRRAFSSLTAYSFLLLAGSILTASFAALMMAQSDFVFRGLLDRYTSVFFLAIGAGFVLFVITNHGPLLRQKINGYFLLTQTTRFPYLIVWIMGIIGFTLVEGSRRWDSFTAMTYSVIVHQADRDYLRGRFDAATELYDRAAGYAYANTKAYYNLGQLSFTDIRQAANAIPFYQRAVRLPEAGLNASNLLLLVGQDSLARQALDAQYQRTPDARIAINLGRLWEEAGAVDSAVHWYQRALVRDPDASAGFSNLARLYARQNRAESAREFLRASTEIAAPSTGARLNTLFHNLTQADSLDPPAVPEGAPPVLRYNAALYALRRGRLAAEENSLGALIADLEAATEAGQGSVALLSNTLILDAYRSFRADSLDAAISRFTFVAEAFPEHRARAFRSLGVAYLEREADGMASRAFDRAAKAGDAEAGLFAAQSLIDAGLRDSAYKRLSTLIVEDSLYRAAAIRERDLLLFPYLYGDATLPGAAINLAILTPDELLRVGTYADSFRAYQPAREAFRQLQTRDSNDVRPYLALSRIYNKYGNPLALQDLRYAMKLFPNNDPLRIQLAEAQLRSGEVDAASQTLAQVQQNKPEVGRLQADIALAQGDSATSIQRLEALVAENPFDTESARRLVAQYIARGDTEAAFDVLSRVLRYDTVSPGIWYYYAWVSNAWNQAAEAAYAARQAIALEPDADRREALRREFAEILTRE